jgi:hypothetical protein
MIGSTRHGPFREGTKLLIGFLAAKVPLGVGQVRGIAATRRHRTTLPDPTVSITPPHRLHENSPTLTKDR